MKNMNKKQKSSIILASLASIAVAGSLIAGSTYALFTSESKTNIAVTSGKVNIDAKVKNFQTYSGVDLTGDPNTDVIRETEVNGTFTNGGTASYDEETGKFTLERMTPGDKVEFTIEVTNLSNVTVKYRNSLQLDETTSSDLFSALKVSFNNEIFTGSTVSHWKTLEVGTNPENLNVVIELPSNVENDYQDKSCSIVNTVEAVQGNAAVYDVEVNDETSLLAALNSSTDSTSIKVTEDVTLSDRYLLKTKNLAIYGDGNTAIKSDDIRVFNIWGDDVPALNGGSLYLSGVDLLLSTNKADYIQYENRALNLGFLDSFDLTINNCEIETVGYGISLRDSENVKVRVNNSKITGYCAFETQRCDCDFEFTGCTLTGVNQWPNASGATDNNYATLFIGSTVTDSTFSFNDCDIYAYDAEAGENKDTGIEYFVIWETDNNELEFDAGCTFQHNIEIIDTRDKFEKNIGGNGTKTKIVTNF